MNLMSLYQCNSGDVVTAHKTSHDIRWVRNQECIDEIQLHYQLVIHYPLACYVDCRIAKVHPCNLWTFIMIYKTLV